MYPLLYTTDSCGASVPLYSTNVEDMYTLTRPHFLSNLPKHMGALRCLSLLQLTILYNILLPPCSPTSHHRRLSTLRPWQELGVSIANAHNSVKRSYVGWPLRSWL